MTHSISNQPPEKPICPAPEIQNIPQSMRSENRWLCWRYVWTGKKWDKPPINVLTGGNGSSTNAATWTTMENALAAYQRGSVDGIGFVLGDGWAGIDLDDHMDGDGRFSPFAEHVLHRIPSYTEVSPSGEGVKIFVRATIEHGHADHGNGIEVYGSGRFFTVTGRKLSDSPNEVADRNTELNALLHDVNSRDKNRNLPTWRDLSDADKARATLSHLSPSRADGYGDWLGVGMALHSVDSSLSDAWDRWSAQSPKHDEQCCSRAWASFGRSGYTLASLIYWADQDSPGWREQYRSKGTQPAPRATREGAASTSADEIVIPVDVTEEAWPTPPSEAAFHGLSGEFVELVEPHSEADPLALLLQFLVAFGNVIGRSAHFVAEGSLHFCNLFLALVGSTSKGRKGSSLSHVWRLFAIIDEGWAKDRNFGGFSSGEGLIWQVRDPIEQLQPVKAGGRVVDYQKVITDSGETDKRLFATEEEFARVLASIARDGNSLSAVMRQAWDNGNLRIPTKNSPAKASGAHISAIGHITRDELRRMLSSTEQSNGFANRFLWMCARRSKALPEGGKIHEVDFESFIFRLREAVNFAATTGRMDRDTAARDRWHEIYEALSAGKPGLLGAVTARAEAQAMRMACLFALLDLSAVVRLEHLEAALALWDYCERSAAYIFADSLGDKLADDLLMAIRAHGHSGMTRTEMRDMFGRNRNAADIARALASLAKLALIEPVPPEPGKIGKPPERWRAKVLDQPTTKRPNPPRDNSVPF